MADESNRPTLDNVNSLDAVPEQPPLSTQDGIKRPDDTPKEKRKLPIALILGVLGFIGVVGIVGIVVLLFVLGVIGGGGGATTVTLNADTPSYLHPDGVAVTATEDARVSINAIPRELFVSDSVGRQWELARSVFPTDVEPLSPLYELDVKSGEILVEIAAPNGADPVRLVDVFVWDDINGSWDFAPATYNPVNGTFTFRTSQSGAWIVGISGETNPQIGLVGAGGGDFTIAYGVTVNQTGEIVGSASGEAGPLLVDARAWTDYANGEALASELGNLSTEGLIVRVSPGEGLALFATILQEASPSLTLVVDGNQLESYDFVALNELPISIWLAPGMDPTVYHSDEIVRMMDTFTANVSRQRGGLFINAESADVGVTTAPVTFEALIGLFGQVEPISGYITNGNVTVGSPVAARINGSVTSLGLDSSLGMPYLTYSSPNGDHTIYLTSAQSLSIRLDWAERYGLGRVGISGYDPSLSAALTSETIPAPQVLNLRWEVVDASGNVVAQQSGDLALLQYLTQPFEASGAYTMQAFLQQGEMSLTIGQISFSVSE